MGIEFKFTRQDEKSFAPLPEGIYELQITGIEEGKSKAGNPQMRVNCVIIDGDREGRNVVMWFSLLENSLWKLQLFVDAIGLSSANDTEISVDSDEMVGRRFQAANKPREYDGKTRDDWQDFGPSSYDVVDEAPAQEPAPAPAVRTQARPQTQTQTQARPQAQTGNNANTVRRARP